jgi:hypothetical protein
MLQILEVKSVELFISKCYCYSIVIGKEMKSSLHNSRST